MTETFDDGRKLAEDLRALVDDAEALLRASAKPAAPSSRSAPRRRCTTCASA